MTKKPTSLADSLAKKKASLPEPPPERAPAELKTLTLRLPLPVHDQLRELAFSTRRSQHSLLMDGLNTVFERYGKPPIAPAS